MLLNTRTISIRTKIIGLIVGAVTCVVVILLAIYVYDQRSQMKEREARLIQDSIKSAAGLAYTVTPHFIEGDYAFMNGLASHYARRAYRSYVMVVDNQNRILARSTEDELGGVFEIPAAYETEEIDEGLFRKYVREGKTFYDVSYPVKAGDLVLGKVRIGLNTDWIGKQKDEMTKTILEFIGVALAVTIVSILGASAMTRKMTGPLLRLAQVAQDVGKGDYTRKVDIKSDDEVGMFADAFNVMIEDLSRSRSQLVDKLYVDSIMAAMEDCLIVLTPEGLIATVNKCALDLLEYKRAELVNRSVDVIVDEWFFSPEAIDEVTNSVLLSNNVEGTFRTKTGRKIPMLMSVSAMGGESSGGLLLVGKDITERKRVEEALRLSEARLNQAQHIAGIGDWEWDIATNLVRWSDELYRIYGYEPREIVPDYGLVVSAMHPRSKDEFVAAIDSALKGERPFDLEYAFVRRDGSESILHTIGHVIRGSDGTPVRMVGIVQDITQRKQQEEALAQSEANYRNLFDSSSDGIFILDLDGTFIDVNRTAYERLGYTREEFLALNIVKLDHPTFAARVPERLRHIREHGIAIFEAGHLRKDGSMMPVEVNSRLLEYRGKPVYFSVVRDITERKRAESSLRLLEKAIESLPIGITICDEEGKIMYVNPADASIHGYEVKELIGGDVRIFAPPELWKHTPFEEVYGMGELKRESANIRRNGEVFPVQLISVAAKGADGKPIGIITTCEDITERRHTEEQIRSALREKDILLKEIHHRVKNNLQVVSSMLRLQADYIADDSARAFFDASRTRVETMSLIHEKLYRAKDLARIDFREYADDLATNLSIINTRSVGQAEVKIDVEGIMLDINNSIPCGLIINELVSNAFKHAFSDDRRGKVTISMRRVNENRIVLAVSDDGIGFPEDMDFRNTSSLGLQLVNSLVTQLDGTIALDRTGGTTFRIEFEA